MSQVETSWKRLNRKTLVETPFLKVYEDKVELPGGTVIDDYTVVEFREPVVVVATNGDEKVLIQREYRYAHNQVLPTLPAGVIDDGETFLDAARRELLEETGYTSDNFEYVGEVYEYPTKASHATHIIKATNIKKLAETKHEKTEQIYSIELTTIDDLKRMITNQEIKTAGVISALYLALPSLSCR